MLNLFHLKCFYDTILMGSTSEAARRNFISQPAVSKAIKSLEETLGATLCCRQKQSLQLTAEGEVVFAKSRELFSAVRELKDGLDRCQKQPKMPLHFVSTQSVALSLFPDWIPQFKNAHPELELHFLLGGLSQIKGWLEQGIAEFALVLESRHLTDYQQFPIYAGHFRLYRHIQEKRSIDTAPCYIEHAKGFLVQEYQKQAKIDLSLASELNSWELIARILESQKEGYGLIPDIVVRFGRYPHLVPTPLLTLPYKLVAIVPKGKKLSLSAQTFLELLSIWIEGKKK